MSLSFSLSLLCPFTDLKKFDRELFVPVLADACVGVCNILLLSEGGGELGRVVEEGIVLVIDPWRFNIPGLVPAR